MDRRGELKSGGRHVEEVAIDSDAKTHLCAKDNRAQMPTPKSAEFAIQNQDALQASSN
jgi:hypothetical protein